MTKTEILRALRERREKGRAWSRDTWLAGFRSAEAMVKAALVTPASKELEPASVVMGADGDRPLRTYEANLTAAEVCGPFNPARALDARKPSAPCPLWRIA